MSSIKTSIANIYKDENDFCRLDLDSSSRAVLGIEEAEEICNAVYEVCDGNPAKLLTNASIVEGFVGVDARTIIRNHPKMMQVRLAEAFVVKSLPNRLIASFYMRFDKPPNPTKIFNSISDAEQWLRKVNVLEEA